MTEIPLFPLSSVLLPGGRLSLQIFEQRYLDLVRRCLKQDSGFGLVFIASGHEVASPGRGVPQLGRYGSYARIVDWDSLPNGLLGITIEGGERFELHETRVEADQLLIGSVSMEARRAPEPVQQKWESLVEVLTNLERHPHVRQLGISPDHADARQVCNAMYY